MSFENMTGKEKCVYLKELRKKLADEYNIDYEPGVCTYKGNNCIGTCKACDRELAYLSEKILKGK